MDINIKIEPSSFLEACCLLEDSENDLPESLWKSFTEEEIACVEALRSEKGSFHLCEFFVHSENKGIKELFLFMEKLSPADFFYYFYNEDRTKEEIKEQGMEQLNERKRITISILRKAHEEVLKAFRKETYEQEIMKISEKLKKMAPLEAAQDYMGKRYARVSDYELFTFVPLKYHKHRPRRFFNDRELLLILPVEELKEPFSLKELGLVLKVIGDPTRLEILQMLRDHSMYGKEIAERLNISPPTITHHIEQLNSIKLLHMEKIGQIKYYSLNKNRFKDLLNKMNMFIEKPLT